MNLKRNGKIDWFNVFCLFGYAFMYFFNVNVVFLTVYYANRANINVASVTVMWSANPIYLAILDYLIYKNKLQFRHIIGILLLVICAILIALSGIISPH